MTLLSASIPRVVSFATIVRIALVWSAAAGVVMNQSADAAKRRRAVRPSAPASQQAADLAWFAGLDYPDVKGARPALVATGSWEGHSDDPPTNTYRYGFVLKSDDAKFTVFFPNLTTATFERTPLGTPEHLRRDFEPVEPTKFLEEYRPHADSAKKGFTHQTFDDYHRRISLYAETFVASACCRRLGREQLAADLYRLAKRAYEEDDYSGHPHTTFSDRLRTALPHAALLHAQDALADGGNAGRAAAAEQFLRLTKNFPKSEEFETARERSTILIRMVKEDNEHAEQRRAGKPFADLSREEQIAELIFQLRDQYGIPEPLGGYDPINMNAEKKDTPGHKLIAIGYDAIPQLAASLDDERLCSVAHGRVQNDCVVTIGECAGCIIYRITGRWFYAEPNDPPKRTDQQRIEEWYAEFRRKGEKRYLEEAVARGNELGADLASRLIKRYPQDALSSLLTGAKLASDADVRSRYVVEIGNLTGDGPMPFLLNELTKGQRPEDRLAAAETLHRRGRPEAVAAMIVELRKLSTGPCRKWYEDGDFQRSLIWFLAACGRVDAIDALGLELHRRPVEFRIAVAEVFRHREELGWDEFDSGNELFGGQAPAADSSGELTLAAKRVLLNQVDDRELGHSSGGPAPPPPPWCRGVPTKCVADYAAETLHKLAAPRYLFDPNGSAADQDRGELLVRNSVLRLLRQPPITSPND